MSSPPALRCEGLCKRYKYFQLHNVDLRLETGSVMGLVGPNGAGKSTLLRIIMGLVAPDNGSVEVLGHQMPKEQVAAKYQIGFIAEDMRLYESQTIGFHMDFIKSIFNTWDDAYAADLLRRLDLIKEQKVKGLSHGQRVKAILLLALARRPHLLVFDEPTTGLDPAVRKEVLDAMMSTLEDETRSILFSSHNTLDVEQISDYITFIYGGRIVESKDKETFLDGWRRLRLTNMNNRQLPEMGNIREVRQTGRLCAVTVTDYHDAIPDQFIAAGLTVEAVEALTLEEIFLSNVSYAKTSRDLERRDMNTPMITRLVVKDLMIWRRLILIFCGASVACVGLLAVLYDRLPYVVFLNLGFTLLVAPMGTLGIVLLMQTNVFEKAKSTQHFIMSLPVTPTDFTLAKFLVNIPVFAAVWLAATLTAFYFAFGLGLLPAGAIPFLTMIFLGIFVAYICILCVSVLSQSLGVTVGAIMFFEVLTPAYLWMVALLEPVQSVIEGPVAIWNSTAIAIVALQVVVAASVVVATLFFQSKRRDFI